MEQDLPEDRERRPIKRRLSLVERSLMLVGGIAILAFLCFVILDLAYRSLAPRSQIRVEAYSALTSIWKLLIPPAKPIIVLPPGTPDSPIVIRGGSVSAHEDNLWQPLPQYSNAFSYQVSQVPKQFDMDGVDTPQSRTTPRHFSNIPLSGSWIITLDFRTNHGTADDTSRTLSICSNIILGTCTLIGNPTSTIYIVGGLDNHSQPVGSFYPTVIDRNGGLFYDMSSCPDDNPSDQNLKRHPSCDHPEKIWLTDLDTDNKPQLIGHCIDGACSIAIQ